MKHIIAILACTITFQVQADVCGNLNDYQVREAVFSKLPLSVALTYLTKGTPFQIVMEGEIDASVTAASVSGALDSVLNVLAKNSGFTYTKEKCVIRVNPTPKGRTWTTRQGDDLRATLENWGRLAGWQVVFDSRSNYTIGADLSASGAIEDAVAALLEAVNRDARSLHATFYYGNQVLRLSTAIEGEK